MKDRHMLSFRQIKIRHIFILQFGGYFVKFYSRQIFRPSGITCATQGMCDVISRYRHFL